MHTLNELGEFWLDAITVSCVPKQIVRSTLEARGSVTFIVNNNNRCSCPQCAIDMPFRYIVFELVGLRETE